MSILEVHSLSIYLGGSRILDDFNIAVKDKSVHAIVGRSGAGKSTLLRVISRNLTIPQGLGWSGRIMLRGDNVLSMPVEIARKEIAYVSQKPQTMPGSVWWNLVLPIAYWYPKAGRDEIASRVSDALDVVGLNSRNRDFRRFRASDLSAGEQQKLALARAIATQPKVLLLDEPTANLDNYDQAAIEELIVRLGERLAVCFVTHNNEQARQISTRTTFMHAGTPFVEDSPVNVFSRNDDSPLGRFNAAKQIDDD